MFLIELNFFDQIYQNFLDVENLVLIFRQDCEIVEKNVEKVGQGGGPGRVVKMRIRAYSGKLRKLENS